MHLCFHTHHKNSCHFLIFTLLLSKITRANRAYLKEHNIRHIGKPLGRASKRELTPYQKSKQRKEQNERNQIEGKFGQGKRAYGMNRIMAKLPQTQES